MPLSKLEKQGDAARAIVHQHYPEATSCYTDGGAEVYNPENNKVLGEALNNEEFPVEVAWIAAANKLIAVPVEGLSTFKKQSYNGTIARFNVLLQYPYAEERRLARGIGVEIFDPTVNRVLGDATHVDMADEQAWINAAEKLKAAA